MIVGNENRSFIFYKCKQFFIRKTITLFLSRRVKFSNYDGLESFELGGEMYNE